jgi:hypothetical protein
MWARLLCLGLRVAGAHSDNSVAIHVSNGFFFGDIIGSRGNIRISGVNSGNTKARDAVCI